MMRVNVKDATAVDGLSKCASCANAHIIRGFREFEEMVYCNFAYPLIHISYKVRDCSNYQDRNRPDYDQMEKLAIYVEPASSLKHAGFRSARNGDGQQDGDDCDLVSVE
jgi:hypothetical protein